MSGAAASWPRGGIVVLDVGGTAVKSGLVLGRGRLLRELPEVLHAKRQPLDSGAPAEAIADLLAGIVNGHLAACADAALLAIAFPGPCDYARGIPYIDNLAKFGLLHGVDLHALLARRIRATLPIAFVNDAQAAALGEALARRLDAPALMLTLGTGFGSAFLDGMAISTRRFPWSPTGELFAEPALGARADDVFSIRGLDQRLARLGLTCAELPRLVAAGAVGEELAAELRAFGSELGRWLVPYIAAAGVRCVIAGGGLARLFPWFGDALGGEAGVPVQCGLLGDRAALVGAALAAVGQANG